MALQQTQPGTVRASLSAVQSGIIAETVAKTTLDAPARAELVDLVMGVEWATSADLERCLHNLTYTPVQAGKRRRFAHTI